MARGVARAWALLFIASSVAASGLTFDAARPAEGRAMEGQDVPARGAFTCDITIPVELLFDGDGAAAIMEIDRMYMADRPGMLRKHIPARLAPEEQHVFTGGRYLFDTYEAAREYKRWVEEDFALDGVLFLERSYFLHSSCHAWRLHGAHDFRSIHDAHVNLRTEHYAVEGDPVRALEAAWPSMKAEAKARGLSSVVLMWEPKAALVGVAYYGDRTTPENPLTPDVLGLAALEAMPPLGHAFEAMGWERVFDRTHWVMSIWFPYKFADRGAPSLWPNSPALPMPGPEDGVCEPSRGEDHATAPADCTPRCGDGVAHADETTRTCPSDVRPSFTAK